ncbi:MAG TPA: hypothetical protein PK691_08660, partial [Thermomicrobiales bacterium]|nr:hypothetical protein [Thermomicrobiales bacterium]
MSAEQLNPPTLTRDYREEAERTDVDLSSIAVRKSPNMTVRNLKRFLIGNKLNLVGLILVGMFLFLALFGRHIGPYDPYAKGDIINSKLVGPSWDHL